MGAPDCGGARSLALGGWGQVWEGGWEPLPPLSRPPPCHTGLLLAVILVPAGDMSVAEGGLTEIQGVLGPCLELVTLQGCLWEGAWVARARLPSLVLLLQGRPGQFGRSLAASGQASFCSDRLGDFALNASWHLSALTPVPTVSMGRGQDKLGSLRQEQQ